MSPPISRVADTQSDNASTQISLTMSEHKGTATYYRATGKGSCSFDANSDLMVAAINPKDYASASMCGAYVSVTGPQGSVVVRITDVCPGCKEGSLDLSTQAFNRIASKSAGRVSVTWQIVPDTASGPVSYRYKESSTRYWTAIQVRNHRWPIASLEIRPNGSTDWLRLERKTYNYFTNSNRIPAGPLRVRVTGLTGEVLEDGLPEPKGGLVVPGAAQFH